MTDALAEFYRLGVDHSLLRIYPLERISKFSQALVAMINKINELLRKLIKLFTFVPEKQCNFETPKSTFAETKFTDSKAAGAQSDKDWAR